MFCIATYGEGEPTDSARNFHKWISDRSLDSSLVPNMKFMVLFFQGHFSHSFLFGRYSDLGIASTSTIRPWVFLWITDLKKSVQQECSGGVKVITTEASMYVFLNQFPTSYSHRMQEDFAAWRAEMWPAVTSLFGVSDIEVFQKFFSFAETFSFAASAQEASVQVRHHMGQPDRNLSPYSVEVNRPCVIPF